jgi:hypothetical protein
VSACRAASVLAAAVGFGCTSGAYVSCRGRSKGRHNEELVLTERAVLHERVFIREETVTDFETVETELQRELISFDTSDFPKGSFRDDQA